MLIGNILIKACPHVINIVRFNYSPIRFYEWIVNIYWVNYWPINMKIVNYLWYWLHKFCINFIKARLFSLKSVSDLNYIFVIRYREIPEENLLTLGTLRYGIRMSSSPRVTERRSMSFPSSTTTNSTSSTNLSRIPSTVSSIQTSSLIQNGGSKDKDCCCIGSSSLPWMHHSHGEHHHHQQFGSVGSNNNNNNLQMSRSTKLPMPASANGK